MKYHVLVAAALAVLLGACSATQTKAPGVNAIEQAVVTEAAKVPGVSGIFCKVDEAIVPVAGSVVSVLVPAASAVVSVDASLIHPEIVKLCDELKGVPVVGSAPVPVTK